MMKIRHTIVAFALCATAQSFSALAQNIEELCRPYSEEFCARDLEEIEALRPLAEKGEAAAQFRLGDQILLTSVLYIIEDKKEDMLRESVRWYRKAAEQGYALAEYYLGIAYSLGNGIAKDRREALRWWRKAAEQGLAVAQYELGEAYATGDGVRMDKQEAARLWRKAAEHGQVYAQHNLGMAYMRIGDGVETDEREAYIWLTIAAENGNEVASIHILSDDWRTYLSQSEIRSARKEAGRRLKKIERRRKKHDKKFDIVR